VIHLAGLLGMGKLSEHLSVNVLGTENLFKALVSMGDFSHVRIVQASSASIYGRVCAEELPISENQPPRPLTAYALSKLAQHQLASAMWHTQGLKVINACIFNTVGPFQPDTLVPMTFIKQLKEIKTGLGDRLHVGDTSACRDFVDIRDVVQAFDRLLDAGHPGETYNIASGCSVSIKKIIEFLMQLSELQIPIETTSKRLRNSDVPDVRADISKIASDTGWKPSYSLYESLKDMWSYYAT
jgi:GDP-4-dehydro-6-deoxy-D-mannose reductase